MKTVFSILLSYLFLCQYFAYAQGLTFASNALNDISEKYVGDRSNWKLVTTLASFDPASNTFTLTQKQITQLGRLKRAQLNVNSARIKYNQYIKRGAMVFARETALEFDSTYWSYRSKAGEGDSDGVLKLSESISALVQRVIDETEKNRIEEVSALLSDKTGDVFRRKGLLGDWLRSAINDQYKKQDGIMTENKSYATLDFVDGSNVLVSPNTIAIIRGVSLDRLTNGAETEIVINRGGLLTSLSAEARQQSNFTILAGNSETVVKSSRFWAFNDESKKVVTYSNYDGEATVKAENKSVKLGKNEGTIVVRGREPSLPVKLLPSPKLPWAAFDTVIFASKIRLQWNPVKQANRYELDISSNSQFAGDLRTLNSRTIQVEVSNVQLGSNYIRLRAFDKNGLRGSDSQIYRILRNEDTQPPAIFMDNGSTQTYYSAANRYELSGITEPNTSIVINGYAFKSGKNGVFTHSLNLENEFNKVVIKVIDDSGNESIVNKQVVKMLPERMLDIKWSVSVKNEVINRATNLGMSGKAYNPISVVVILGGRTYRANCGINGEWALNFPILEANELTLTFINASTGESIVTKSFRIQ